jgi:hypothetical protein
VTDLAAARLGRLVGALRVGVGVVMIAAPGPVLRAGSGRRPDGDLTLMTRTVGVRDLVIGAGTLASGRSEAGPATRRWIAAGLCSDALDCVIGAASVRQVGRKGALVASLAPVPFIALDLAALAALSAEAASTEPAPSGPVAPSSWVPPPLSGA